MTTSQPLAASQSSYLMRGRLAGSRPTLAPSHRRPRGFSLIEVLLAIFILGIGIIGIAALFPAGIAQQQRSVDDVMGPIVANNALSILRSKLRQNDFGSWEDFGFPYPPEYQQMPSGGQIPGDWLWRRPAIMYADDGDTEDRDERGAIDIFGWVNEGFAANGNASLGNVPSAADDLVFVTTPSDGRPIPYNPLKHGYAPSVDTPVVVFTQGERMYPMSDRMRNEGIPSQPQYYWDCMFRKFEGKVLVAIFVYRVTVPGSEPYIYSVPPDDSGSGVPFIPFRFDFADVANSMPWDGALNTWEHNSVVYQDITPATVPETGPGGANFDLGGDMNDESETVLFKNPANAWQITGQWFIDQNNNVHRVLAGRERPGEDNRTRPIELVERFPAIPLPNAYSGASSYFYDRQPANGPLGAENVITHIWYLPRYIDVDLDGDGSTDTTVSITPVYATVEEL